MQQRARPFHPESRNDVSRSSSHTSSSSFCMRSSWYWSHGFSCVAGIVIAVRKILRLSRWVLRLSHVVIVIIAAVVSLFVSFSSTLAIVCDQRFIVISVSLRRSWHLSHPLVAETTAARSCGLSLELRRSSARICQEHHGDQRLQYETRECSSHLSVATAWTWQRNQSGPMHIGQKIGAIATALLKSSITSNSRTSSSRFVWDELSLIWILVPKQTTVVGGVGRIGCSIL